MSWLENITVATSTELALAVFTRTPIVGQTKTRLATLLGNQGAMNAHIELVEGCLARLQMISEVECSLWVTEMSSLVETWSEVSGFTLCLQRGDDLGARMYNTLNYMLETAGAAVLMGTDCPDIDAKYVRSAFTALQTNDLVFAPAEDGGYGLVGMRDVARTAAQTVFEDISWGGSQVLAQSLAAAADIGLQVATLPTIWDVDTPADWQRYLANLSG